MNFTRIAAVAAVLTIPPIGCALAKPATVSAEVNLRKAPGTESEVVTLIPKGTKVEVGKCNNGWCQVSWNGQEGFAIARNLGIRTRVAAQRPRRVGVPVDDYDEYGPDVVYGPGPYPGPVYYRPYYGYGGPYGPYWGPRWGWGRRW